MRACVRAHEAVSFSHIVWYGTGTGTGVSFSHIVWYGTGTSRSVYDAFIIDSAFSRVRLTAKLGRIEYIHGTQ